MIKINFDQLIKNYDQDLLNDLRGFGKNNEYLKYWVPGTDNLKSFLNLLDALIETDITEFEIEFQNINLDFKKVEETSNKVSKSFKKRKISDSIFYYLDIDKNKYIEFKKIKIVQKKNTINLGNDKTKIVSFFVSDEDLVKSYQKNLDKINCKIYSSEKQLSGDNIYKGKIKDLYIEFRIEEGLIVEINNYGSSNIMLKKFINTFSDIALKKTIQEVSEHGVIYLEEKIRMIDKISIKKGIILPNLAGKFFAQLNQQIRAIEKEYYCKNDISVEINRSYFETSGDWKNLSLDDKKNKIMMIINENFISNNIIQKDSIKINKIDNNFKIFFDIDKSFREIQNKKNILLELENKLKVLDNTLEIFVEEIIDKNKLRLKNSPQNI